MNARTALFAVRNDTGAPLNPPPLPEPHPAFGPCDAFAPGGACSECMVPTPAPATKGPDAKAILSREEVEERFRLVPDVDMDHPFVEEILAHDAALRASLFDVRAAFIREGLARDKAEAEVAVLRTERGILLAAFEGPGYR